MTRREMLRKLKPFDEWVKGLSARELEGIRRIHGCPAAFYQMVRGALDGPIVDEMTFGPNGKLVSKVEVDRHGKKT